MRFSTCAIALALMTTASAATAQTPPSCGPVNLSSVGGSADLNICDADAFLTSVASGTVSGAWVEPTDSAYLLE
ncbi:MAG: hypothetical protein KC561_06160, partial [Myxococcales bacterium]|nr:hypothetical protein [Myxococcales bacterium]